MILKLVYQRNISKQTDYLSFIFLWEMP